MHIHKYIHFICVCVCTQIKESFFLSLPGYGKLMIEINFGSSDIYTLKKFITNSSH